MVVEHRNAPRPDPVELVLRHDGPPYLEVLASPRQDDGFLGPLKERIVQVLSRATVPLTQEALRAELRVRLQNMVGALRELEAESRVRRHASGWTLPSNGSG
jgi:hypothetical protein